MCKAAFFVSTKTNFSTVESHITIVKLLKYIKKKYIVNLNVTDEGDYYETGDKEQLQQKWDFLLKKFDEIAAMLEDNLSDSDKSMTDNELLAKIENIIRNNSNEDSNPAKSGFD